jgi:hypothetical protein
MNISKDFNFVNKLLFLWSRYLSDTVTKLDDHVSNSLRSMTTKDRLAIEKSLPFCKII